jgi:hypothetical protein
MSWTKIADCQRCEKANCGGLGYGCKCGCHLTPEERGAKLSAAVAKEIKCACGRKVYCQGMTTTCECGREYNWAGQQLAPRNQWGEETGEHPSDLERL